MSPRMIVARAVGGSEGVAMISVWKTKMDAARSFDHPTRSSPARGHGRVVGSAAMLLAERETGKPLRSSCRHVRLTRGPQMQAPLSLTSSFPGYEYAHSLFSLDQFARRRVTVATRSRL